jgi:hypothetical protein
MMYKYVLLYFLFIGFSQSLISQSATETGFFQQLSVTATPSNRAQGLDELYNYQLENLTTFSPGELSASYGVSSNLSLGLGLFHGLGNPNAGFFDRAGRFYPLRKTGRGYTREGALLAILTTNPEKELPVFVQFSVGYSFASEALAFTGLFGARRPLYRHISITGGVRASYLTHRIPGWVDNLNTFGAIRMELGVNWSMSY